uniref:Uncharacterized protein n=1 Tax=Acrobeloides nanus TaxID=290746 RepID=A0A914CVZ1_9BILA
MDCPKTPRSWKRMVGIKSYTQNKKEMLVVLQQSVDRRGDYEDSDGAAARDGIHLADMYVKLFLAGWSLTREEIQRDVERLFGGANEEFMQK